MDELEAGVASLGKGIDGLQNAVDKMVRDTIIWGVATFAAVLVIMIVAIKLA